MRLSLFGLVLITALAACAAKNADANAVAATSIVSADEAVAKNPTDLPAYPNVESAMTTGCGPHVACIYQEASRDSFVAVRAWYRARFSSVKEMRSKFVDNAVFYAVRPGEEITIDASAKDGDVLIALSTDPK